jgi:hypothetical protein
MHYFLMNAVKKHEAVNEEQCNTRLLLASVVTWPEVQRLDEEAHVPCLLKSHPGCIKRHLHVNIWINYVNCAMWS